MTNQTKYIDADDFRTRMYEEAFEKDSQMQKWDSGCWIRYKLFENMIKAQPPADVVPVVKGEWVHRKVWHPLPWDCPPDYGEEYDSESHSRLEDEWHCSNCDYETDPIHKEWWHFCPNCGAAMTEEALRIIAERNKWGDEEGKDDEKV